MPLRQLSIHHDPHKPTHKIHVALAPNVAMKDISVVPQILLLAVVKELKRYGINAAISWPRTIMLNRQEAAYIVCHASYDRGIKLDCELITQVAEPKLAQHSKELGACMYDACAAWEKILATTTVAGPFAPYMEEFYDLCSLAGHVVDACDRSGVVRAHGRFAGIDAWARITLVTPHKSEFELAPDEIGWLQSSE